MSNTTLIHQMWMKPRFFPSLSLIPSEWRYSFNSILCPNHPFAIIPHIYALGCVHAAKIFKIDYKDFRCCDDDFVCLYAKPNGHTDSPSGYCNAIALCDIHAGSNGHINGYPTTIGSPSADRSDVVQIYFHYR